MDRELHRPGTPPRILQFGAVVQVLRRGHQRPLLCLLEEQGKPAGLWVVKAAPVDPERSPTGQLLALCELAGSEACAFAGVPTPSIGLLRLPDRLPDLAITDRVDREVAERLLSANLGRLAFCSRWLGQAENAEHEVLAKPRRRVMVRTSGLAMLIVDVFIRNVDRRVINPNALLWRGELIAIDHGHAFDGLERAEDVRALARSSSPAFNPHEHLLVGLLKRPSRSPPLDPSMFLAIQKLRAALGEIVSRWPDELDGIAITGRKYKTLLTDFLDERLANPTRVVDTVMQILKSEP